ncbi:MAG: hypothetical protein SCH70_05630 [Candidatus Methanoperedens sp.]|nr:hypothetical protein [Candidatus Methanoperedens sp.]
MAEVLILQSIGITGVVISFIIIAKLSERMGEGLMLPKYYRLDYVAAILALSTIPVHIYLHRKYELPHTENAFLGMEAFYIFLLLVSNIIVIIVSIRYWWWLKDEIMEKKQT